MRAPIQILTSRDGKTMIPGLYACNGRYEGKRCKTQLVAVQYVSRENSDVIVANDDYVINAYDDKPIVPGLGMCAQPIEGGPINCLRCDTVIGKRHGSEIHFDAVKVRRLYCRDLRSTMENGLFIYFQGHRFADDRNN